MIAPSAQRRRLPLLWLSPSSDTFSFFDPISDTFNLPTICNLHAYERLTISQESSDNADESEDKDDKEDAEEEEEEEEEDDEGRARGRK